MMPTFPSPPLKFRTVGLPQYGFKAGLSDGAFLQSDAVKPAPRHPHVSPQFAATLRALRGPRFSRSTPGEPDSVAHRHASDPVALPQGPSLRSGLCCPGPSTLNRPHPPHSRAHRDFTAQRLIRDAFAVRVRLGDPRAVPCFRQSFLLGMSSSKTPGSSPAACAQFLRRQRWSSPTMDALDPSNVVIFGATYSFACVTTCQVACLHYETFTSGLPTGRSPFPSPDMTTVSNWAIYTGGTSTHWNDG